MVYEGTRKFYFDLDLSHTSNTVRDKFSVVRDGNLTNSFPLCFVLFFLFALLYLVLGMTLVFSVCCCDKPPFTQEI